VRRRLRRGAARGHRRGAAQSSARAYWSAAPIVVHLPRSNDMTSDFVRSLAVWVAAAFTSTLFIAASTSFAHGI